MSDEFDIVEVAVDDIRPGDALAVTDSADPRPDAFLVASVESVQPMQAAQMNHVKLTSSAVGRDGEPLVLDYPPGTMLRKIVER